MASAVALSGRRIDAERRQVVAAAIRARLIDADARLLVCSAACGADLLALDAAGALAIRRRILLPFAPAVFRETSVTDRPGDWGPLFDRILAEVERAGDVVILGCDPESDAAYSQTVRAILDEGDALMAASACTERLALAVWEGPRRQGTDVTREFLDEARRRRWPTAEISTR
jgi:hypothetical protein